MLIRRMPKPALRPFVKMLWASDGKDLATTPHRERVVPTGTMHLAFRLSDHPLRLFEDTAATVARIVGHVVVGGARSSFYVREVFGGERSVGVQLHPGAAAVLFGVPCDELAERHTPLEQVWGPTALWMRDRLGATGNLEEQLDVLESMLAARLPRVHGLHPAIAQALEQFATTSDVGSVVKETGYSHRRFIALFSKAVGLTPKRYCRVLRFQGALRTMAARPRASWIEVALDAGYSDQPHFNREFRELVGVTPGEYRRVAPTLTHHVPIR